MSKSPPKHRHDGRSPLPLGMDASPAPQQWDGAHTIWPHDPRTGWSYCVTIPSWIKLPEAKTADGNYVNHTVFYRLHIGVQSPQGISASRGILRRFSDFLKLFAALKQEFPSKGLPAPPPKNTFLRMNSSHSLLQERQRALDDWLSMLLADIEVSRSAPIAAFLELEAAAREAVSVISETQNTNTVMSSEIPPKDIQRGSWTGPPSVASTSILEDGNESISGHEALANASDKSLEIEVEGSAVTSRGNHIVPLVGSERQSQNGLDTGASEHTSTAHLRRLSLDSIGSELSSAKGSEQSIPFSVEGPSEGGSFIVGVERRTAGMATFDLEFLKGVSLFLPTDYREKVRRILIELQRRLSIVKTDIEDLITRLNQETAVKEFLTIKVRDLEAELDSSRRRSREVLQQAVSVEHERVINLQWELEECNASLVNAMEVSQSEQKARAIAEEKLQETLAALTKSEHQVSELVEKYDILQKEKDTIEAQSRGEKRLLAKEIKALRKSQHESQSKLDAAVQGRTELERFIKAHHQQQTKRISTRSKFLHEIELLRQKLYECSIDFLAKEDERSGNRSGTSADAIELLRTSDDRISLLLAEAQLILQEAQEQQHNGLISSQPLETSYENRAVSHDQLLQEELNADMASEIAMKKLMLDIFIDNAQLRKSMNSLTRNAVLTVETQRRDKEATADPLPWKNALSKFLQ